MLWLKPSYDDSASDSDMISSLHEALSSALPLCRQRKDAFTPHFTASHFDSADEAREAGEKMMEGFEPVSFLIDRVYLMSRNGGSGQFKKGITVMLGTGEVLVHEGGEEFELMPDEEFEWVAVRR